MDQIEQDFARFKQPAMALTGGIAAALVVATLPHVYLEDIVGATGLSEVIPAAAPPLGNTARGLIALVAGLISASTLYLFLTYKKNLHEGGSDMSLAIRKKLRDSEDNDREAKPGFAMPRLSLSKKSLTQFLKKPKKTPGQVTELKDLPDTRPADRHPDAPTRQPIFASSDLGTPLAAKIQRFDQSGEQQEPTQTAQETTPPDAAESIGQPSEMPEHRPSEKEPQSQVDDRPAENQPRPLGRRVATGSTKQDLSALSLDQLADRLEAGLERLEALQMRGRPADTREVQAADTDSGSRVSLPEVAEAEAPVAMPPLRSVDSVQTDGQDERRADMDAALKAALGTLERMTVHR